MGMTGIDDKKILRVCRLSEYGPVRRVDRLTPIEFAEWFARAKARQAKIIPNGVNGCIVITENRYFTIDIV